MTSQSQWVLEVYRAQPRTDLGVDAVMAKLRISRERALHEINKALRDAHRDS